jgi:hypothetical protein
LHFKTLTAEAVSQSGETAKRHRAASSGPKVSVCTASRPFP